MNQYLTWNYQRLTKAWVVWHLIFNFTSLILVIKSILNHYLVWDYQELTKAWAVLTSYFQLTSSSMKKSKQISLLRPRFQSKMRHQTAEALVGFKQAKLKTVSRCQFHSANPNICCQVDIIYFRKYSSIFFKKRWF